LREERSGLADGMRRRFTLVVPRLRDVVPIGNVIDRSEIEPAALADSLDMLSSGLFLVDAAGRIVHANLSGHTMLSEANVVEARDGSLGAIDPQDALALLVAVTVAGGPPPLGGKRSAIPIKGRNGTRYIANVLPLSSSTRHTAHLPHAAAVAIFVHKAALDLASLPEIMAKEYGLTPAEVRVLFAIVEFGGVSEVAELLGSAENTVKTHLHHLFEKTGTSRQADLVKLVAGYAHALLR